MRIGVDLGGTKIEVAVLDDAGVIQHRSRAATPRDDYAGTVASVAALVGAAERAVQCNASVGVAMPGAVSPATGLLKNANSTWLNGRPFGTDLGRALNRQVRLANDANCFTLSEAMDGAGADATVVFGVIIGTGTGGGWTVEKRLVTGANAIAGEWGHNPMPWPTPEEAAGPACYCGRLGCIETYLSGPGLARTYREQTGASVSGHEVAVRAGAGEDAATQCLRSYEMRLARALAHVINVLDPDVVVLGGGLSKIDSLYERVPQLWGRWIFSDSVITELRPPLHGDSSGVRGAAWLWPTN